MKVRFPSDVCKLPEEKRPAALKRLIKKYNYQDSLDLRISAGVALTESEISACMSAFAYRCRQNTKAAILFALQNVPHIRSYGIYRRILLSDGSAEYCAGQDYDSEMRTVRECLVG